MMSRKAVRLPSSLISLIASHIPRRPPRPPPVPSASFSPAASSSHASPLPLHAGAARISFDKTTHQRLNAVSQAIVISPISNHVPLSLAHSLLNDTPAPSPCSSTTALLFRQRLYTTLVTTLLKHRHPLSAVYSLLRRSLAEDVPLSTATLTQILRFALDSDLSGRLVAELLPALPQEMDDELLTLVLHAVTRTANPGAEALERIIEDCLSLRGISSEQEWPLAMWDVLMSAHARQFDFRGGVALLARFKHVLRGHAVEGEPWTEPQRAAISRPYISLMALWINSRYSPSETRAPRSGPRLGSGVPSRLADDLEGVLGTQPPVAFMNVWMNAERVAENHRTAAEVWERLSGWDMWEPGPPISQSTHSTQSTQNIQNTRSKPDISHSPDATSYATLFKLYKPTSQSPPRRALGHLLSSRPLITTSSLNSALSAVLSVPAPDLPAAFLLLEHLSHGVFPDTRTVDIVAAGLVRAWRGGLPIFTRDQEERSEVFRPRLDAWGKNGFRGKTKRELHEGLSINEWDMISHTLHRLRLRSQTRSESALLPVGRPLARLTAQRVATALQAEDDDHVHGDNSSAESNPLAEVVTRRFQPARNEDAKALLSPLKRLLQKAVVLSYARRPEMRGVLGGVIFKQAMAEVRRDALGRE
jgi:hypothetical protein